MKTGASEWIVGFFVLIGILLIAGLILLFNKNAGLARTYQLRLVTPNVGLLIPSATVRMAGVPVGYVDHVDLANDGKSVTVWLRIYERFKIHRDARFLIEQIGFLGDQFISIVPQQAGGPFLQEGDQISCEEPFNLQEVARSAVGLIRHVDQTVQKLDQAVSRVDQFLFSETTLTNLTSTVVNFRHVSERAFSAVENFDAVITTNVPTIGAAMSNLVLFSQDLAKVAQDVSEIVNTNRDPITSAIQDMQLAAAGANSIVTDLQTGKGFAGFLLKDEEIKLHTSLLVSNLTTLSSNLNRFGLLYKPKKQKDPTPSAPYYPGRRPF